MQSIPKTESIKICNDFAHVFLDHLSNMAADSDEARLVFDIYIYIYTKNGILRRLTNRIYRNKRLRLAGV